MKKISSVLLSACLLLTLSATAFAQEPDRTQESYSGQFIDVSESSWYAPYVQIAYMYGLMDGVSDTLFAPDSNLSVAEALVIACRLHGLYDGVEISFPLENPWYQPYVRYSLEKNILPDDSTLSFTDPVTRADFALFIKNALPDSALSDINEFYFPDIPDVYSGSPLEEAISVLSDAGVLTSDDSLSVFYMKLTFRRTLGTPEDTSSMNKFEAIYTLYEAGILTGNDQYGSFTPDANITRSAVATIISRVVDPSLRQHLSFIPKPAKLVPLAQLENLTSIQKNASNDQMAQAYEVARKIVEPLAGLRRETQLVGVALATRALDDKLGTYSVTAPHYNDPYGFFVLHTASCAGCTRATGLCLNMLGIPYEHVNENQYTHQWTRVNVNGTYWICDAYGLYCGPEHEPYKHPNF